MLAQRESTNCGCNKYQSSAGAVHRCPWSLIRSGESHSRIRFYFARVLQHMIEFSFWGFTLQSLYQPNNILAHGGRGYFSMLSGCGSSCVYQGQGSFSPASSRNLANLELERK